MITNEYLKPMISVDKRRKRVNYAINELKLKGDSFEKQEKNLIYKDDDMALYMEKPGKDDGKRKGKNKIHDLTPIVIINNNEKLIYNEGDTFKIIWSKIYELDNELSLKGEDKAIRKLYLLIYRLAYMVDFECHEGSKIFLPSEEFKNEVIGIQKVIDKHRINFNVKGYLAFLDLLGWNEDYKYQYDTTFSNRYKGRLNCILCMISVPLKLKNLKIKKGTILNLDSIIDMCYTFSMSRGIYVLDKADMINLLDLEDN